MTATIHHDSRGWYCELSDGKRSFYYQFKSDVEKLIQELQRLGVIK